MFPCSAAARRPRPYNSGVTVRRAIWCEVRPAALQANLRALKARAGGVRCYAVVKANGYGHGAALAARAFLDAGSEALAVHNGAEAADVRAAGLTAPLLYLGAPLRDELPALVEMDLEIAVPEAATADALAAAARAGGRRVPVHLKIDTGMNRLGVQAEDAVPLAQAVARHPELELLGIFSQFACADEPDPAPTREQIRRFDGALAALAAAGLRPPIAHLCNGVGIISYPEAAYDAVRPGLALYGISPLRAGSVPVPLEPALTWKARVVFVKQIPAGATVSYGATWRAPRPTTLATLAVGYKDGYPRACANRGAVLLNGKRAPVAGRVCMDVMMVDATDCGPVRIGDEAVLLGAQGGDRITGWELADWAETMPYEILCRIDRALPRVAVD